MSDSGKLNRGGETDRDGTSWFFGLILWVLVVMKGGREGGNIRRGKGK